MTKKPVFTEFTNMHKWGWTIEGAFGQMGALRLWDSIGNCSGAQHGQMWKVSWFYENIYNNFATLTWLPSFFA